MKSKIEEILDQILDELSQGKAIDEILIKYPDYAQELKPLLKIAQSLKELPKPMPSEESVMQTVIKARNEYRVRKPIYFIRPSSLFQPALIRVLGIIAIIAIISIGSFLFSSRAIPGDVLYPAKIFSERIQYTFSPKLEDRVELRINFASRRTDELLMVFERQNKLDKNLLESMLNETEHAYYSASMLPEEKADNLLRQVAQINNLQKDALKKLKKNACPCDTILINEALNKCISRCQHLENRLNPQPCPCDKDSCTCW